MGLCERLGWPHPDYLLPYLTWEHWKDWQAFLGEVPAATEALDTDHDVNLWSDDRKRAERAKLEQFKAEWLKAHGG